jgi:hypothetical protein
MNGFDAKPIMIDMYLPVFYERSVDCESIKLAVGKKAGKLVHLKYMVEMLLHDASYVLYGCSTIIVTMNIEIFFQSIDSS